MRICNINPSNFNRVLAVVFEKRLGAALAAFFPNFSETLQALWHATLQHLNGVEFYADKRILAFVRRNYFDFGSWRAYSRFHTYKQL